MPIHKYNIPLQLTTSHIWSCQSGTFTQIPLLYFWQQSVMVHNQHIWPHQTVTSKLHTYPNYKGLASLQSCFLIIALIFPTAMQAAPATPYSGYLYHTTQMMSS